MQEVKRIIQLSHFKVKEIEPQIIHVLGYKDGIIDTLEVKQVIDACIEIANHLPYHNIVDVTNSKNSMSDNAKKFYKNYAENSHLKMSQSVVYNSLGKGVIIGSVLKMINYISPHKFFLTLDDALKWVKSLDSNEA